MNVVIVDDNPATSMSLKRVLVGLGHRIVEHFSSGEQAIAYCSAQPPDVIMMGKKLGGSLNGIETWQKINSAREVPVIFVSENSEASTDVSDHIEEFHPSISAPVTSQDVSDALQQLLNL